VLFEVHGCRAQKKYIDHQYDTVYGQHLTIKRLEDVKEIVICGGKQHLDDSEPRQYPLASKGKRGHGLFL
jgi:hypothetical protein